MNASSVFFIQESLNYIVLIKIGGHSLSRAGATQVNLVNKSNDNLRQSFCPKGNNYIGSSNVMKNFCMSANTSNYTTTSNTANSTVGTTDKNNAESTHSIS